MWHEAMGGANGGRKGGYSFFSPLLLLYFYVKKIGANEPDNVGAHARLRGRRRVLAKRGRGR